MRGLIQIEELYSIDPIQYFSKYSDTGMAQSGTEVVGRLGTKTLLNT
jgi:hypothetical protein